jgi:hypothetical protein
MGQKHLSVTVNRLELVCHKPILSATTSENRKTQICNKPQGEYICYPQLAPNMFTATAQHSASS